MYVKGVAVVSIWMISPLPQIGGVLIRFAAGNLFNHFIQTVWMLKTQRCREGLWWGLSQTNGGVGHTVALLDMKGEARNIVWKEMTCNDMLFLSAACLFPLSLHQAGLGWGEQGGRDVGEEHINTQSNRPNSVYLWVWHTPIDLHTVWLKRFAPHNTALLQCNPEEINKNKHMSTVIWTLKLHSCFFNQKCCILLCPLSFPAISLLSLSL